MSIWEILLLFAVGVLAGGINTLAGGGSLLTLPVLITFIGLPPNVANATNRLAIFFQNIFATQGFKSKGVSTYPFSLWIGLSACAGAILGSRLAVDIKGETFNQILAVVIVLVVIYMLFGSKIKTDEVERIGKKHTTISIIVFFFIGIYGGFIQAGVGYLIMASLTLVNRFDIVKTNATKVFVVLIYTVGSLAVFIYTDLINWQLGLALAVGNSTGGWLASRWSVGINEKYIRYFVMLTASAFAIKLFFF